ncbi:MAG: hypothetical protein QM724_00680 [Flavobacteriales bacterium]
MRKSITTTALLTGLLATAQAPFERGIPIPGNIGAYSGTVDKEGHYVMASRDDGNTDIVLTRLSPTGELEWSNRYAFFMEEGFYGDAIVATDDGVMVAGYTLGAISNSRDAILLHVGFDGSRIASYRIDVGGSSNAFHWMRPNGHGGFLASGRVEMGANQYDMMLADLNADGTANWVHTYGGLEWDWGHDVITLQDGGHVQVGFGDGWASATTGYVVRTDADGNELWSRSIQEKGKRAADLAAVAEANDGSGAIYVGGRGLGFTGNTVAAFISKLSSTGDMIWTRVLPDGNDVQYLWPAANGGVNWVADPQFDVPSGAGANDYYDIAWGRFEADGTLAEARAFGGSKGDYFGFRAYPSGRQHRVLRRHQQLQCLSQYGPLLGAARCDQPLQVRRPRHAAHLDHRHGDLHARHERSEHPHLQPLYRLRSGRRAAERSGVRPLLRAPGFLHLRRQQPGPHLVLQQYVRFRHLL